jgi:hypothetical protein
MPVRHVMPVHVGRAFVSLTVSIAAVRLLVASDYRTRALFQLGIPVHDPLFPIAFRDPLLLLLAILGPLITEFSVLWRPTLVRARTAAVVEIVSATILLIHQASFFRATWVVIFWGSWLLAWLAWTAVRQPALVRACGPILAQVLVAFFFLGGAVGKWTAGYWSGEPFHDILFRRHTGVLYQYLRATADESTLRYIATIYSRSIVIFETAMIGIVLVPPRIASVLIVLASVGLWVSSSVLYEIVFPIIGLAAVVWHLAGAPDQNQTGGEPGPVDAERSPTAVGPHSPFRQ